MDSPKYITPFLATSPFLYTDSFEASDSSDGPLSQDPYVVVVACWRSQPYHTRPMTSRKRVGPLPAHRLAWRHVSPRPLDHRPSSSSSSLDSLPVHSSGGSSERPLHSSSHSAGPSRKRCRSPVDSISSSTPVIGSLAPTYADLLPPRKRFRDSYSSEDSIKEDTKVDPIKTEVDIELGIGDGDDVRDHVKIDPRDVRDDIKEYEVDTSAGDTVKIGIDLMSALIVEEEIIEPAIEDSSDSSGTRDGTVMSFEDMPIDLDDARWLEADQLIARGERVGKIERIESLRLENLKEEFRQVHRDRDDTRRRLRRLESYLERHLGFRP
ncbi:hypothetical protein Tco_1441253 [Tanacetum coccineum]